MTNEQLSNFEELKTTVVKSLETSGLLSQIRAQLRANVFKAIGSSGDVSQSQAKKLGDGSPFTLLSMELVAEFFQFHGLHHSLSVFQCEAQLTTSCTEASTSLRRRSELVAEMDLEHSEAENCSVLEQLVEARRVDLPHRSVSEQPEQREEVKVQVQAQHKDLGPPKKLRSETWATPACHSGEGDRRTSLHRRLSDPLGSEALQSLSQQMAPGSLTAPVGLAAWGPGRGRDIGMLTTSPLGQRQRLPPLSRAWDSDIDCRESASSTAPPVRQTAVLAPSSPNLSPANSSVGTIKEGTSLEPGSDASASGVSTTLPHTSPAMTSPGDSAGTLPEDARVSEVVPAKHADNGTKASCHEDTAVTRTSLLRNSRDKKAKGKPKEAEPNEEVSDTPEIASTRTSSPAGQKPSGVSTSLEENAKRKSLNQDQIIFKASEGLDGSYPPSIGEDFATPSEEEEFGEVPEDALLSSPSSASSFTLERPKRSETQSHQYDYVDGASA